MSPPPNLSDLIALVHADTQGDDPLDLLRTAIACATDLDRTSDALVGHFVDRCRFGGHSWTEISAALGVSKQAAHKRFNLATPPLDRFTPRARRVIDLARTSAGALNHHYIGTEHLLLALLREGGGIAAQVLGGFGVNHQNVEEAILLITPRGETPPVGESPFTPRAATVFSSAITAALELGHNYVGTEHLLLALLRDPEGLAGRILSAKGLTVDNVRTRVVDLLADHQAATPPEA